ncbi:hypothetical protein L6452_00948 [Arctium lappa]|uniref:Uncharacterized protein n=1 Tax=Arctium lappa TaxID=4217 RepID=A0ACB9FFE9_ARCLA|nr:hypothetical protein L6452_00948 [Arctium lappa]
MIGYLEDVSFSFLTAKAYVAGIKGGSEIASPGKLIQDKVDLFSENLRVNQTTTTGRVKDGVYYLAYLVVSTSMHVAS